MIERGLALILMGWTYNYNSSDMPPEAMELYSQMYMSLGKFVRAARVFIEALLGLPTSEIPGKLEEVS